MCTLHLDYEEELSCCGGSKGIRCDGTSLWIISQVPCFLFVVHCLWWWWWWFGCGGGGGGGGGLGVLMKGKLV